MISKVIIRGFVLVALLFGSWFALRQVDWITLLEVDSYSSSKYIKEIETQWGELMRDNFLAENDEVTDSLSVAVVDSLAATLCKANGIDKKTLDIYILDNSEVNAFALPNRQLIIYTGLIEKTDTPEALCGVMAHELAHIEKGHVMQSLKREIGLGVLFRVITGRSDFKVIAEVGKLLSSSAFSRRMEQEADLVGLEYLQKAHINPEPFAAFLGDLAETHSGAFQWISSHPLPDDRENYVLKSIKDKDQYKEVISKELWQDFKNAFDL